MPHNNENAHGLQPMTEELTPLRIHLRLLSRQSLLAAVMLIVFLSLGVVALVHYVRGIRYQSPDLSERSPVQYRIDINSASWIEFAELPGVGETLARRIVDRREKIGGFKSVDALDDVPGVGKVTLTRIRAMLYLQDEPAK